LRALLVSIGSRGDIQPPLALATALLARGHDVTYCAPPDFRAWIEAHGPTFVPLGRDFQKWAKERADEVGSELAVLREMAGLMGENVADEVSRLVPLAKAHDVVVSSSISVGGPTAAEVAGVPYVHLAFVPSILPSKDHAPFFLPFRTLPRWTNRLAWSLGYAAFNRPLRKPLNAERAKLGLGGVKDIIAHLLDGHVILCAEPDLCPPVDDDGRTIERFDSLLLDERGALSADTAAFLDEGEPPLYIGFGSMPDPDPAGLSRMLIDAVERLGVRALISSGWAELSHHEGHGRIRLLGPEPHALLFPRCAAVVHHGGAGTTTAALRAGRPQLIVPFAVDQPDWGHRVARAGIGPRPIPRRKLTTDKLVAALERCLHDDAMKARAAKMASGLGGRRGNEAVAARLEQIVAKAQSTGRASQVRLSLPGAERLS